MNTMHRRSISAALAMAALAVLLAGCDSAPGDSGVAAGGWSAFPTAAGDAAWPQWGGPGGDFHVADPGLAAGWGEAGPRRIWQRTLGPGYSAVVAGRGALYTMYRREGDEVAVAMRGDDGRTIWEHAYAAPTREVHAVQFGKGPNATPLLLEDRVITLGYTGILQALDDRTGEVHWSHDLLREFGGTVLDFGNSASPIRYQDTVIVLVGGAAQGAVAFHGRDGSVAWRGEPTSISYSTPLIINVDGQDQVVYYTADEIVGLDAAGGRIQWRHAVLNQYSNNCSNPIWGEDQLLWAATQMDGGTRVLRLQRHDSAGAPAATSVEEIWANSAISIHFWNALRIGDAIFASTGNKASSLTGVDVHTGAILWKEPGFKQANFIQAGQRTLLLDAEGHLALARLSAEEISVDARARVVEGDTWTVPTLAGTTLYVRDQSSITALDLGP